MEKAPDGAFFVWVLLAIAQKIVVLNFAAIYGVF
jgi:hypothetical protein